MIIVNLDELNLPCKEIPSSFINEALEKHCNKTKCTDCKYNKLIPYENCETAYALGHNLMRIDYEEKYIIISNEELRFICNQNIYCSTGFCAECRYNYLIYNEDDDTLNCTIARIIAHRIITGEITRDQYIVTKGENI